MPESLPFYVTTLYAEHMKWLSALSFFLAVIISVYVAYSYHQFKNLSEEQRLENLITADFAKLRANNVLPRFFDSISKIETQSGTEQAKEWLKKIKFPFKEKQDGEFTIEVLLMSFEEDEKLAAVIQYNVVDNKTHDMVWEFARTFYLKP